MFRALSRTKSDGKFFKLPTVWIIVDSLLNTTILNYIYCGDEWNGWAKAWTQLWIDLCTPTHYLCYPSASGTSGRKTVPCERTVTPRFKRQRTISFICMCTLVQHVLFGKMCFVFHIIAWMRQWNILNMLNILYLLHLNKAVPSRAVTVLYFQF